MTFNRLFSSPYSVTLLLILTYWVNLIAADISTVDVQNDATVVELLDEVNNTDSSNLDQAHLPAENTTTMIDNSATKEYRNVSVEENQIPVQIGPLIDIFGQQLLSLEIINGSTAKLRPTLTSDALRGKKVIGLYFSADWCGPCRKFTPELVSFYKKINQRRGKKDEFEIVWISRCRDVQSYGQYFTQMGGWFALPPEEAMGKRGSALSDKYKVKGIPTLVLLDDLGQVITLDGRNKISQDKAGIGFPWRNPFATLYMTIIPRSLRLLIRFQVESITDMYVTKLDQFFGQIKRKLKLLNK
jgi:nucleoredoxin